MAAINGSMTIVWRPRVVLAVCLLLALFIVGLVAYLIATATAAGAETISLIPRNDGQGIGDGERQANLLESLREIKPLLADSGMIALVEPLGFPRASLRNKSELVEAIDGLGAADQFRLVHDTFHHALAGGGPIFPGRTGIVHISGVVDPLIGRDQMEDEHRVLVDENDRLGNIQQLRDLLDAGYDGPISCECFSPETQSMPDPATAIGRSLKQVETRIRSARTTT